MTQYQKILAALLICFVAMGCGDDGGGGDGDATVVDLRVSDRTLAIGEQAVLTVDFSFSADAVFDEGANVILAVKLPRSLAIVQDSSEIQGIFSDKSIGAQGTLCANGEAILIFELDKSDLDVAENPDGDADARLTFTYQAVAHTDGDEIQARAEDLSFQANCLARFEPEAVESIAVPD